jgi:hypothetical protein
VLVADLRVGVEEDAQQVGNTEDRSALALRIGIGLNFARVLVDKIQDDSLRLLVFGCRVAVNLAQS